MNEQDESRDQYLAGLLVSEGQGGGCRARAREQWGQREDGQTEAQDGRERKQFSESQLWGGGCRVSQEQEEEEGGRGLVVGGP